MASREIEQFRRHGLGSPICIKPGLRSYLFLLFAGPLLIGGSVLALAKGGPLTFLAGLIGLPLSAFACLLYLVILLRSRRRGLIEFREVPIPGFTGSTLPGATSGRLGYSLRAGAIARGCVAHPGDASTYMPALASRADPSRSLSARADPRRAAPGFALKSFSLFLRGGAGSDTLGSERVASA